MKKLAQIFLTFAFTALAGIANAQYSPGDLQLVFRQSGASDVEYNIGSVSNYLGLAAGTVLPVAVNTNLVATNFGGTLSGVSFAVVGVGSKLWLSDANTTAPVPSDVVAFTQNQLGNKVGLVGTKLADSGLMPLVTATTNDNSYSYIVSDNTGNVSLFNGQTPFAVDAASDGVNPVSVALYEFVPTSTSPKPSAIKVGTFTLAASGAVTFTAAAVTPVITSPALASQSVTRGANPTFSVAADGGSSYQWYWNGQAIAGATNSSYTAANAQLNNEGSYSVVVSNTTYGTSVTSGSANLAVSPANLAGDLQLVFRQSGASDVEYNIGSVSNYLGLAAGTVLPVAVNTNLVTTNFGGTLSGVSFAVVGVGSKLWLSDANTTAPVPSDVVAFTQNQLGNKVGLVGTKLADSGLMPLVTATTNDNSYSYIVSDNTGNVSLFNGQTPFAVDAASDGVNPVSVALYEFVPTSTSPKPSAIKVGTFTLAASGAVTFTAAAVTPVITSPALAGQTIGVNGTNTFSISADGGSSYQWYLNGAAVGGAINSSYSVSGANLNQGGNYSVVVSNPTYGTSATNAVTLTVVGAPGIATSPADQSVNRGAAATFSVVATNAYTGGSNPPLTYQWYKNASLIGGATGSSLTVSNVQPSDVAGYYVVVSNLGGSAPSASANLTLTPGLIAVQNIGISRANGVTTISFVTTNGNFYQLLSSPTLPAVWQTNAAAGVLTGDNTVQHFTDNNTNKSQFYRIQSF